MKAVILAGGLGSRLSEETHLRPKPMVEIGGRPILWHIMKIYSHYGIDDFIVCLGYKGYVIKEYFVNFVMHRSDITVDLVKNQVTFHHATPTPWRVTLVETGDNTMTGGRMKRVREYLAPDESFCMTYGDGVADINIKALTAFHKAGRLEATLTTVQMPGRYGSVNMDGPRVREFTEKPPGQNGSINGGFFVLQPSVLDRIEGDHTAWEAEPLVGLARDGQLAGYHHDGFWRAMDTLRDKNQLEEMWTSGRAPWRVWK